MRVAIIGAGLAGCAAAYILKKAGLEPVIYEAGNTLANGASGNSVGLYNPRFTAEVTPEAEYFSTAFFKALSVFEELTQKSSLHGVSMQSDPSKKDHTDEPCDDEGIDWHACGALHLINDDKKAKRFAKTVQNWGWDEADMRIVDAGEASQIAGVEIQNDALYLPRSGYVSPKKLCEAYAQDVDVHVDISVEELGGVEADVVVLACGPGVKAFYPDLPIGSVRGQITEVAENENSRAVKTTICYGGYFSPSNEGQHIVGSTFQRWLDHADIIDQDDVDNIVKLAENVPSLDGDFEIVGRRASVRATSKDHFPIVGHIDDGVYVSAAHGSHGILSSLMAAEILAAHLTGKDMPVFDSVLQALSPKRFMGAE